MALVDNAWYVNFGNGSSTGYYAVTAWATGTVTAAGAIRRQLATPAVGSERVFVCIVAGTTHATTEPTWVITRGGKTTDNTVTWQECTGIAALNGDATNTPSWTITATPPGGVKNTSVTLGQVIKRDSGASYQICTTAGTAGNGAEPAFSNTAGVTTSDNTVTWTSLGVVGNFTGWQAPHARTGNAIANNWGQAGNAFYVGSISAETQATTYTINNIGSNSSQVNFYSVNTAGSKPPVSADLLAGATITTTGATQLTISTPGIWDGFIFQSGSGATSASLAINGNSFEMTLRNCSLQKLGTNAQGASLDFGSGVTNLINTTAKFGNVGDGMRGTGGAIVNWYNTSPFWLGTPPTNWNSPGQSSGPWVMTGIDFSAFASGTIFNNCTIPQLTLIDCKIAGSVTVFPTAFIGQYLDAYRIDSAGTNYQFIRSRYQGMVIPETAIVRTGGATDGTTPISFRLTTTANARWGTPLVAPPITIWNDSTSAITTLTFYGTTTGGGVPNNDDIWVEVEYLGSSGSPLGSFITTTKADNLAASGTTNNSSDGSTWGGGGAGNGFKIVVPSFTPGMKGYINITFKAAKVSSTYYIDPKPSISGITVSKSAIAAPGVYANELSSGGGAGMLFIPDMAGT